MYSFEISSGANRAYMSTRRFAPLGVSFGRVSCFEPVTLLEFVTSLESR